MTYRINSKPSGGKKKDVNITMIKRSHAALAFAIKISKHTHNQKKTLDGSWIKLR